MCNERCIEPSACVLTLCVRCFFSLLYPQMVECCSECLLPPLQRTEREISTADERRRRESQMGGSVGGRVGKTREDRGEDMRVEGDAETGEIESWGDKGNERVNGRWGGTGEESKQ